MAEQERLIAICERIAQQVLHITLKTQHSDALDFHNIAVWKLQEALVKAVEVGVTIASSTRRK